VAALLDKPSRRRPRYGAAHKEPEAMAEVRTLPTRAEIQRVVDQIVARFRPQKVILFGSYAGGTPTADSDVDLLVTMETPLPNVEQAVAIRREVSIPFPTDLLVRTPDKIAERLALGDVFMRDLLTKGVVLDEATDARVG
jgi:predicted nucleotidyltransferase